MISFPNIVAAQESESAAVLDNASKTVETKATRALEIPGAEDFVYRDGKPEPMRLYVFKPRGWKADDKRPAFVFFFGGGWTRGTPEKSASWAKWAAQMGFVGVAPDYRTNERFGTTPLECVADGRAAVAWVQRNAAQLGINPEKVVVGGSSAGGHVALWTAIKDAPPGSSASESPTAKPAAVILMSTVSDTSMLSGYTPKRFGTNAEALSPVHHLDAKMPPVLAFHGNADRTVPFAQAIALNKKLTETGNASELVEVPDGDHGFSTQFPEWKEKGRSKIREFLTNQKLLESGSAQAR